MIVATIKAINYRRRKNRRLELIAPIVEKNEEPPRKKKANIMTKIIGIAGQKRAGKTTTANFLVGHILKENDLIEKFSISPKGELVVNCHYLDSAGDVKKDDGVLDMSRTDEEFVGYASKKIWPYVKVYNFADPLKVICMCLFGLTSEQVYGEDKDTKTDLVWENMPNRPSDKGGNMSAREVMQHLGTNVFRKIKDDVWVRMLINRIKEDGADFAIAADVRFPNEVSCIKEAGGTVIHLGRSVKTDSHPSETSLVGQKFDLTIGDFSIEEVNTKVLDYLKKAGVL